MKEYWYFLIIFLLFISAIMTSVGVRIKKKRLKRTSVLLGIELLKAKSKRNNVDISAHLLDALKKDPELREAYISQMAMDFYDEYYSYTKRAKKSKLSSHDIITISNNAANLFIRQLCDEIEYTEGR